MDSIRMKTKRNYGIAVFLIASIMYYINDFLFIIFQDRYLNYILADYGSRIFSILALIIAGYKFRDFSALSKPIQKQFFPFFLIFIISVYLSKFSETWFNTSSYYSFPEYPSPLYRTVDLTFGLILVAISEEVLFRGYLINLLKRYTNNSYVIIVISCFLFALIHWGTGVDNTVKSFVWAIVPSVYYIKTKNLIPCIIGHYFANLIVYY